MKLLDYILTKFRICFSRLATFEWFVIIVLGLIISSNKLEVTSIIRDLNLKHQGYEKTIHFFRLGVRLTFYSMVYPCKIVCPPMSTT